MSLDLLLSLYFILLVLIICLVCLICLWFCCFACYSKHNTSDSSDGERNLTNCKYEKIWGREGEILSQRIQTNSNSRTDQKTNSNSPPRGNSVYPRPHHVNSPVLTNPDHGKTKGIVAGTDLKPVTCTTRVSISAIRDVDLTEVRVDAKNQPPSLLPSGPMPMQTLRCKYVSINTESQSDSSKSELEQKPELKPEPESNYLKWSSNNASSALNGCIIVVVDATPRNCGGYCIWHGGNEGKFYTVKKEKDSLPWEYKDLSRRGNSSEFEMKNSLFALLQWTPLIVDSKELWFATDNNAINGQRTEEEGSYGYTVRMYLRHLRKCHKVRIMNDRRHHVHKGSPNKEFSKYILPADYLSWMELSHFEKHMRTHFPEIRFLPDHDFQKVWDQVDQWTQEPCPTCEFCITGWFIGRNSSKITSSIY